LSFFFFFNNERERREREREKERFLSWFLMGADMTSFGQNFGASRVFERKGYLNPKRVNCETWRH